jgi:hypothetical protein
MARRKPTPDELREIVLAYVEQGDPTNQHGERRQRAFQELMDAGLSDRQALAVLDNPIAVLRAGRVGAEGTPGDPVPVSEEDWDSLGPVLDIFTKRTGVDVQERRSLRRGLRSSSKPATTGDDDPDEPGNNLAGAFESLVAPGGESVVDGDDIPDEFFDDVAEALTVPAEDGIYPDPFAVITRLGNEYGLTPEQMETALEAAPTSIQVQQGQPEAADLADELRGQFHRMSDASQLPNSERVAISDEGNAAYDVLASAGTATAAAEARNEEQVAEAIEAGAEIWAQADPSVRPDLSSIEDMLPPGVSIQSIIPDIEEAAIGRTAQEVQQSTGASTEEARVIAEQQTASADLFTASEPDWLLQLNQGNLSDQQKDRYVDYWNDAYGTFFRDFDRELAPILGRFDGTETEAQNMAAAVLADQEPLITEAITLPLVQGERKASYTTEQMEQLRTMGFSNDAITRLVRLSAITSGEGAIRPGDVGDTLRVGPLAMLARYYGGGQDFADFNQTQQEMAELEQQLGLRPGQYSKMTFEQRQGLREQYERNAQNVSGITVNDPRLKILAKLEGLGQGLGRREEHGTTPGIIAANNNFRRGMDMYRGDELLSYVHAIDAGLAQRVAATGGDPDKLDWRDNAAVFDIMERGGLADDSTVGLRQLETATGFFGYFNTGRGAGGGGGGGAGPMRRLIDPVQTKEAIQQLWSRMFLGDVDDATVASMTANLQKQLDEAPEGMAFDISSRIAAFLKGQDVYDELYRNKPAGMAEEEYQSQFAAGVGDMLGNELDPDALKAGMRSGDYNTAVGRAASSDKLLTNSTLRGRWAEAKQTLDMFT